jgi:hypothetical protein
MELAAMESTERLHGTRPWNRLTTQQKLFCETFIGSGGDAVLAAQVAYDCASERNARILSYEISNNEKIRAVLDLCYGVSEKDRFMDRLKKRIEDGSLTIAEWNGMRLLCRLKGWAAPASATKAELENSETPDEPRYAVGDIVLVDGKKCRVNEVNNVGRPIDVDEIE